MPDIQWYGIPHALGDAAAPIVFWVKQPDGAQQEVLRFELNGDCYVRGEKVDSNPEVYRALSEWMERSAILPAPVPPA